MSRPVAAATSCLIPESSNPVVDKPTSGRSSVNEPPNGRVYPVERKERRFVAKEEQLEKLRNRLYITKGTPDSCKNCKGGMVSL